MTAGPCGALRAYRAMKDKPANPDIEQESQRKTGRTYEQVLGNLREL